MNAQNGHIIAVANQKGGVGKTTTSINIAQALATLHPKVLLADLDPQGNATRGLGVKLDTVHISMANLLRDWDFPVQQSIYQGEEQGLDLIAATPHLASAERELVGATNSELRLAHHLRQLKSKYTFIVIDTPPTFGPLMNSALNAADSILIPVDSSFFALLGIKELLNEIEIIRRGTNPNLKVLGYLVTMADSTNIAQEVISGLINNFNHEVFSTRIRRSVKLREAPALGRSIFHHSPHSSGAQDYLNAAVELLKRIELDRQQDKRNDSNKASLSLVQGVRS